VPACMRQMLMQGLATAIRALLTKQRMAPSLGNR
jgi:hypothetical protein